MALTLEQELSVAIFPTISEFVTLRHVEFSK